MVKKRKMINPEDKKVYEIAEKEVNRFIQKGWTLTNNESNDKIKDLQYLRDFLHIIAMDNDMREEYNIFIQKTISENEMNNYIKADKALQKYKNTKIKDIKNLVGELIDVDDEDQIIEHLAAGEVTTMKEIENLDPGLKIASEIGTLFFESTSEE